MPEIAIDKLSAPFRKLHLGLPDFEPILNAYHSEDRHYHNWQHVEATFDALKLHGFDSPEAEIALMYHDVVYDTHAANNEAESAHWAERDLIKLGASAQTIELVTLAIQVTDHKSPITHPIQAQLADVDLSILGVNALAYRAYADAIRKEYSWVPERDYWMGRSTFLSRLLEKPTLYHTQECRDHYAATASINLRVEVAELEARLRATPNPTVGTA